MKTTVELPDDVLLAARLYAAERGKTFKQVLTQSLEQMIFDENRNVIKPGWESLFGAFADDRETTARVQAIIDEECSSIDLEDWT